LRRRGQGGDFTAKMAYAYGWHSLKNCKCKKEKGTKLLMGFEFAIPAYSLCGRMDFHQE
jgi:hypothetical protein